MSLTLDHVRTPPVWLIWLWVCVGTLYLCYSFTVLLCSRSTMKKTCSSTWRIATRVCTVPKRGRNKRERERDSAKTKWKKIFWAKQCSDCLWCFTHLLSSCLYVWACSHSGMGKKSFAQSRGRVARFAFARILGWAQVIWTHAGFVDLFTW